MIAGRRRIDAEPSNSSTLFCQHRPCQGSMERGRRTTEFVFLLDRAFDAGCPPSPAVGTPNDQIAGTSIMVTCASVRSQDACCQIPTTLMKCVCGQQFDSHRIDDTVIHVPHITARSGYEIRSAPSCLIGISTPPAASRSAYCADATVSPRDVPY